MFESYFDPPESPEPPECCDALMEVRDDGSCYCPRCNSTIPAPNDDYEVPVQLEDDDDLPPASEYCPHGRFHGECDACDFAGDLAFDAAREQRCFGRR
jgi:hypothetical protein